MKRSQSEPWRARGDVSRDFFSLEGGCYMGKITRVYDGDTVWVQLLHSPGYQWKVRINGIDTPEIRTADPQERQQGILARDYVRDLVLDRTVLVYCGGWDKYGRLLARIITPDNVDLASDLIAKGFAKSYDGGHKEPFRHR